MRYVSGCMTHTNNHMGHTNDRMCAWEIHAYAYDRVYTCMTHTSRLGLQLGIVMNIMITRLMYLLLHHVYSVTS